MANKYPNNNQDREYWVQQRGDGLCWYNFKNKKTSHKRKRFFSKINQ